MAFIRCRPKAIKEEPSGIVFPSYDTTEFPYYALLHGLSNVDADGIAVGKKQLLALIQLRKMLNICVC